MYTHLLLLVLGHQFHSDRYLLLKYADSAYNNQCVHFVHDAIYTCFIVDRTKKKVEFRWKNLLFLIWEVSKIPHIFFFFCLRHVFILQYQIIWLERLLGVGFIYLYVFVFFFPFQRDVLSFRRKMEKRYLKFS